MESVVLFHGVARIKGRSEVEKDVKITGGCLTKAATEEGGECFGMVSVLGVSAVTMQLLVSRRLKLFYSRGGSYNVRMTIPVKHFH